MTRRSRSQAALPDGADPPVSRKASLGCLLWFFRLLSGLILLAFAALAVLWFVWGRNLPNVSDLDVLEFSGQTRVYDRSGILIGTLSPSLGSGNGVNRDLLKLSDISPYLQKAVVTSEDRRFFEHHGVDYMGIARGLIKGLIRKDLEGGSSITQQVVKNTLLADLHAARTPERKFKEAVLAYQLDRDFDKNQILNAYLNIVYWGDGGRGDIVGAQSAATAYFKKDAKDLNLAESVYLATIIPAPNRRYKSFQSYRPLMKGLLGRMVEDGRVTRAQADEAWKTPIYPAGWRIAWNGDGTLRSASLERPARLQENIDAANERRRNNNQFQYYYYLQAVEKELLSKITRKALYDGGKIYTGMDVQAQQAAEKASLQSNMPRGATMGIALVNPANGEAMALVGQNLFDGVRPNDWNNATQARRQVGSSIKPFLYTLALSKGWKQKDTVLDSPIEGDYQPMNYDRHWTGRYVTMRYALDHSLNLPTVRIGQEIGMETFQTKLRELGFTPPTNAGLSLSIGTLEASPLQMAAAYAPFANGGVYYEPYLVRRFVDKSGKVLYTHAPVSRRVWDEQTAWLGLDMIRGVVNDLQASQGGLATRARIDGWQVGGKTGTTNEVKDLWFVGVTPLVSGAVWVGKEQGGALPDWAYSGTVPTPVWQQSVAGALQGHSQTTFKEPGGITYQTVRGVDMALRSGEEKQDPAEYDGTGRAGSAGTQMGGAPLPAPASAAAPPQQSAAQQSAAAAQAPDPVVPANPDPAPVLNEQDVPAPPQGNGAPASADDPGSTVTLQPSDSGNTGSGDGSAPAAGNQLPPLTEPPVEGTPSYTPPGN
ncbi:transglycosylase domain-containing protein [Deinococcus sp.]|uniref:transglycosylase domain-containing protein n=1 Tax=Deinococcus sp. TaxID=47478 RepID=UPI0025C677FB|nr:transglycosylase domain-containing protein [Deinococcus sp.]